MPYEVVIQERKRVDLYGNVVYYIYWFDKYGNDITNKWKFWSKGPKKKYDRVNRYLTDSWIKEYCKNNNLKISRIKVGGFPATINNLGYWDKNRVELNEDFHTVRLFNTVSVYGLMFGPIKQNNFITLENDIMQINIGSITYI